jgi:hypothetical protein
MQRAGAYSLTHCRSTEDDGFKGNQFGISLKLGLQRALKPAAVEQDRLLRQPGEPRASRQADIIGNCGGQAC